MTVVYPNQKPRKFPLSASELKAAAHCCLNASTMLRLADRDNLKLHAYNVGQADLLCTTASMLFKAVKEIEDHETPTTI